MKMWKREYSKNKGFREVQLDVFTGSQPLTLEPNQFLIERQLRKGIESL